jgi:hypothetical protein
VSCWIRSPTWDGCWILSGLPLGLGLTVLWRVAPATLPIQVIAALFLANAHALAPIVVGWGNSGFRQRILTDPRRFVWLPAALLVGATAIGVATSVLLPGYRPNFSPDRIGGTFGGDWRNPFLALIAVYVIWNTYHFGMQNFGVLRLYARRAPTLNRRIDMIYACGMTWAIMVAPLLPSLAHTVHALTGWLRPWMLGYVPPVYLAAALVAGGVMCAREAFFGTPRLIFCATLAIGMAASWWVGLWIFAIVLVNHWLVAIGLASRVRSEGDERSFAVTVAALSLGGAALFAALFLRDPSLGMRLTAWAIGIRIGLGFVHFLYDRWLYRNDGVKNLLATSGGST